MEFITSINKISLMVMDHNFQVSNIIITYGLIPVNDKRVEIYALLIDKTFILVICLLKTLHDTILLCHH